MMASITTSIETAPVISCFMAVREAVLGALV